MASLKGEGNMGRLRKVGGEAVGAGTYWNFETGKKVKIEQKGLLPGKPSQSYYNAPPFLILAGVAAAAHLIIYVLPKYIAQLYTSYAGNLVSAYVIADFVLVIAALSGLFIAGARDIFGGTFQLPSFGWLLGRSYTPIPVEVREEDDYIRRSDTYGDR